jgi:hypothetical protein
MKQLSIIACVAIAALIAADAAFAQINPPGIPFGASKFNPPLPPPPPSPKIEVPVVPQMDAPPRQNYQAAPRPSFSDKITTCLQEGAAAGLGPSERAEYSRACANSR